MVDCRKTVKMPYLSNTLTIGGHHHKMRPGEAHCPNELYCASPYTKLKIFTNRISERGNAIASVLRLFVRQSVRPSVSFFLLYLQNRLTTDLELLQLSRT